MSDGCCCYLLCSVSTGATYVGATKNIERRIRQHNGKRSGGARSTARPGRRPWAVVCTVHGFRDWSHCLSFEWHVKHVRGGRGRGGTPLERRCRCLLRAVDTDPQPSRLSVRWWEEAASATVGRREQPGELPRLLDEDPGQPRP